ncbi:hypothetical protein G7Z17_g10680 [Cylindrodendrum hubeiense]|uniref:Uncharacterized protein n=1 Tax=Cylindrodendrum hubeiense TaxID=595255 RepID=A0A9P5GXA6_9HYPO|nr:hypothetical protein G7Z17_g10680 [Cylindrodendrum hubeiense]
MASFSRVFKSESLSNQISRWTIHQQEFSPLFAVLPAEIRVQIFSYALAEDQVPIKFDKDHTHAISEPNWLLRQLPDDAKGPEKEDLDLEECYEGGCYSIWGLDQVAPQEILGGEWLRPGTSGRKIQHTSLLLTCRRVFTEARDILTDNATIRLFGGDYDIPPNCRPGYKMDMFTMSRYTANRLTSFHLHAPMHIFEHGYLFQRSLDMCAAQDIRLTIRQGDWWKMDPSPPQLTPYGTGCVNRFQPRQMQEHMKLTKDHGRTNFRPPIPPIPFEKGPRSPQGAWGAALSRFPRLERFTIDFEYNEDRFDALLELAEWAQRVWRFRLGGHMKGYYLSAAGIPIKKTSWRGLACHWTTAHFVHRHDMHSSNTSSATCCALRNKLMNQNIGPRMYTFTVTWTARKLEPEDGDDPSILGPEDLSDRWNELPIDGRAEELSSEDWLSGEVPNYELLHPNRAPSFDTWQ